MLTKLLYGDSSLILRLYVFSGVVQAKKKKERKNLSIGVGANLAFFSAHRRPWLILAGWTYFLPLLAVNFSLYFEALTHVWDFRILRARLHPPERLNHHYAPSAPSLACVQLEVDSNTVSNIWDISLEITNECLDSCSVSYDRMGAFEPWFD